MNAGRLFNITSHWITSKLRVSRDKKHHGTTLSAQLRELAGIIIGHQPTQYKAFGIKFDPNFVSHFMSPLSLLIKFLKTRLPKMVFVLFLAQVKSAPNQSGPEPDPSTPVPNDPTILVGFQVRAVHFPTSKGMGSDGDQISGLIWGPQGRGPHWSLSILVSSYNPFDPFTHHWIGSILTSCSGHPSQVADQFCDLQVFLRKLGGFQIFFRPPDRQVPKNISLNKKTHQAISITESL